MNTQHTHHTIQDGKTTTECCGKTPFELPKTDTLSAKVGHTPTPWYKQGSIISPTPTGKRFAICEVFRDSPQVAEANIDFIVKACNAHEDLLAACKWLYAAISKVEGTECEYRILAPEVSIRMLKAAIAKAQE